MIRTLHQLAGILGDVKAASRGPGPFARRWVRSTAHRTLARSMRRSRWLRP